MNEQETIEVNESVEGSSETNETTETEVGSSEVEGETTELETNPNDVPGVDETIDVTIPVSNDSSEVSPMEVIITEPVELDRQFTEFQTGNGTIQVIHEITLGEIVSSTLMIAILFFFILDRFVRR